jgi:hypothetical protein
MGEMFQSNSPPDTPVTIVSPADGATVSSAVPFSATYNKGGAAQYMKVWVDGSPSAPALSTATFNTSLDLSGGRHELALEAGDSAGVYTSTIHITVGN